MDTKEKQLLHRRAVGTIIAIALGAIIVFLILQIMQQLAIQTKIKNESMQVLNQVSDTLETNRSDMEKLKSVYHELNRSTASDLGEVMDNGLFRQIKAADSEGRAELMSDIVDRSEIPYLFIMNSKGRTIAAPDSKDIGVDLVDAKLLSEENLLKLTTAGSDDGYVSETNDSGSYFFYSEAIKTSGGKQYVVFGTDASILEKQLAALEDISRVIKDIVIGEDGFIFAVDQKTGEFIYYVDDTGDLSGKPAADYGLEVSALTDKYSGNQNINGTSYFCISRDCGDYTIAVAATEISKLRSSSGNAWQWSVASFIVIALLCIMYALLVSKDVVHNHKTEIKRRKLFSSKGEDYYLNVTVMKRIMPVILLSVFFIFGISFYAFSLLGIKDAVTIANVNINELKSSFEDADVTRDTVEEYYENQYLAKARILALLFEENPDALNSGRNRQYFTYDGNNNRKPIYDDEHNELMSASRSAILRRYCKENEIGSIYIYDQEGRTIATSDDKWYFTLSYDEDDQSYAFRDVLDQKVDSFIQSMGTDEAGNENQYIGTPFSYYTTTDSDGNTRYVSRYEYEQYKSGSWSGKTVTRHSSLLQIGVKPEVMNDILATTEYETLLKKSTIKDVYLVLFDDSDEHKVIYSPAETSIGKTAEEIGLNSNAFFGDYIGFQRVNGKEFLLSIQYREGYYIGSAILKSNLFEGRTMVALITALFGLIFILFMTVLITLSNEQEQKLYAKYTRKVDNISDRIMFLIPTPSGDESVTEKAMSRWDNKNIPWRERTPEQKLATVFFAVVALTIISIMLVAVLVGRGRINDPVLAYVITGNWDKSFNIFALTACGLIFVTAVLSVEFLNIPIRLVTRIFGTKSETVGHLLSSVLRYAATIYSIFFCLYLLGINTTSLLTSAGILSLIVGFGSQSLIKDIIAGIFIIFEGEFRVGDIVTINGYRGQVLDVGLRTTKLMGGDNNIKIINNSEINEVINMTRVSSVCAIKFQIPVGISLDEVESILKAELPPLKKKIPQILDGPKYDGVKDSSFAFITIQVSASCSESDISKVNSKMHKEVLDILYRHEVYKHK